VNTEPLPGGLQPHRGVLFLVLAAIALTAINLRTSVTGFSPLLDAIGSDLSFDASLFGIFGTIVTASFAVFGFLASFVSLRFGVEATLAAATLLTAAGIVLRALSPNPVTLVLTTVVLFAGVGTTNVLIVPIVKRYFGNRLKAVSSMYLALLQFGQFLAPLLAVPIGILTGWRIAVGVWAILALVACVLWFTASALRRGGAVGSDWRAVSSGRLVTSDDRVTGVWRSPVLWSMVLMFAMTALNTYVIITWLPAILIDAGADPSLGGALLALFSVFGLAAAFVVPNLTVNLGNPVIVVIVCVVLLAVGYLGLLFAPLDGAVIWVVALGLGVSTFPMCLTLVNVRTRTTSGSSLLSGAMQGIGYGIACIGPLLIGLLHNATNEWGAAYVFLFLSLIVLLVSGIAACRTRFLEDRRA
jgi:CP family cyanate transporter-like MFS transporter